MTESASQITTATPRQTKGRLGTVGRPIFGTDVTVVDENGTPVEPGETGEIVVDGPTITPGYIDGAGAQRGPTTHAPGWQNGADGSNTAALDRSSFGSHGLHTGDVGCFDDEGYLYVLNRLDDRIITGGENVEPGEVIDVLESSRRPRTPPWWGLDDDVGGERVSALLRGRRPAARYRGDRGRTDWSRRTR